MEVERLGGSSLVDVRGTQAVWSCAHLPRSCLLHQLVCFTRRTTVQPKAVAW